MINILFLTLVCFFAGCAPKLVDSCQFSVNVYGQIIKHKNLPLEIHYPVDLPHDFYLSLQESVAEINRDRKYIELIPATTDRTRNFTSEFYLSSEWEDDRKFEQGKTSVWWSDSYIREADVAINLDDYNYRADGFSAKTLFTHELLHALGMAHQKDDSAGIMYPYLAINQTRGMTEREYKNLECAYGK